MTSIYDIKVTTIDGEATDLSRYKEHYMVIVNTASKCGLVSQLEGLEEIYRMFKDKNVVVLGFPCNQFLNQEPLENQEIKEFCRKNYDVSFPLFEKINVNGKDRHPLYHYLIEETGNKKIKWNFTKFIVTPHEEDIVRFDPTTSPDKVKQELYDRINES